MTGLTGLLVGTVGLTACGSGSVSHYGDRDPDPTATRATSSGASMAGDLVSRDDLVALGTVEWTRYEVVSDTSIRVFFVGGNPECYGVKAQVYEDETTVAIQIQQGALPDAPPVCAALAILGSVVVATESPVGARSVIPHQ